jgi:hypothetical protein
VSDALADLGRRIERVALDPDAIESQGLFRVARPLFALTGWRAKVRYTELDALVKAMRETGGRADHATRIADAVARATRELDDNVTTVERAAIVRKRPPVAYAAWLRRAWELVTLASRASATSTAGMHDAASAFRVGYADRAALLPPLALGPKKGEEPGELASEVPTEERVPETEADARLVELELASIDRLLDAARAEQGVLGRKRRLLVAARQRLLEASAALPLDGAGARARTDYVAREIARVDRFQNAGLSADAGLVHQARMAVARGDPRLAYAALAALEGRRRPKGTTASRRSRRGPLGRCARGSTRGARKRARRRCSDRRWSSWAAT